MDVQPGATLAPGLSVGSLTTQNVSLASGSLFLVEIDARRRVGVLAYSGAVMLPPAVPTLPWWALLLLSYLLFHLGVFRLRNRPT